MGTRSFRTVVRRGLASLLAVALLFATGPVAQANPYDERYFTIDPPVAYPGGIVRLTARAGAGATGGEVDIAGRRFPGYIDDGLLIAFFAVDLGTVPGPYRLDWRAGSERGSLVVTVRERSYIDQTIDFAPQPARLDHETLLRVEDETALLEAVWAHASLERLWDDKFDRPTDGALATPFGLRRVVDGQPRSRHSGLDIRAEVGKSVRASNGGRVALVADHYLGGRTIVIDHGLGLYTHYTHLSAVLVAEGDTVVRGQTIGAVGASGRATHAHLHWGARLGGARIDPITLPGFTLSEREWQELRANHAPEDGGVAARPEGYGTADRP